MGDDEGNANDSNDTASTVANPYIKKKRSVTYEEVLAIDAAARKSTNTTSSKSKTKRKRRQTTQQVRAQVEKCQDTRKRNKAIKEAAKAKAEAEAEKKKKEEVDAQKLPFFRKYTTNNKTNGTDNNTNESTNNNDTDTNTSTTNNDTNNTTNAGFIGPLRNENNLTSDIEDKDDEDVEGDKDEDVVVDNPPLKTKTPYDIIANLDYDEEEERGKNDSDDPPVEGNGVMQEYIKAVKERLQIELGGNELDKWLLDILKKNDWWIRTSYVSKIRKKLHLPNHYDAYYRDIFVWLPDIRWNDPGDTFMPPCPHCKCNTRVGAHCFRDNHHARLVVNLNTTYYIMSRRYICHECKQVNKESKANLKAIAEQQGINMTIPEEDQNERSYTFMGYDKRVLPLFKYNRGETEFPAYFTWRAGLDKTIINMMRPLFDGGFRPERLSDMLLELHSKEYTMQCIKHENMILQNRESIEQNKNYTPLTSFGDKKHYHGIVPSGEYLAAVHKLYHKSLRDYMDMEVKKRGAETLHWDVSYKEAKHLCRYHGRPIFKGLVTAVNGLGEVRIQFHVYTDSHEQMKSALEAFKLTTNELGLPEVRIFFTDNPAADHKFYPKELPSLQVQQEKYDDMCNNDAISSTEDEDSMPFYTSDRFKVVKVASTNSEIERLVMALREGLDGNRIGLDTEWNINFNASGMQTGSSSIQTIQIAYRNSDKELIGLVFKVGKLSRLHTRLETLLTSEVDIYGVNVSTDLKYIGRDFHVVALKKVDQKKRKNVHNLGMFARVRDVVQNGGVGLSVLCERVLKVTMDKTLQVSDWSEKDGDLTQAQIDYAINDAGASLEVAEELVKKPDLTRRLEHDEVTQGRKVDLIPSSGSVACMATRAATGTVAEPLCTCPDGIVYQRRKKDLKKVRAGKNSYVIKVEKTYARGLILPGYKWEHNRAAVTLGDMPAGQSIIVPIRMIKEHAASSNIRTTPIDKTSTSEPRSKPSTDDPPIEKRKRKRPNVSSLEGYEYMDLTVDDDDDDDDKDVEYVKYSEEEELEDEPPQKTLTSADIEYLFSALSKADILQQNERSVLESPYLSSPPDPKRMKRRFSSVLGDVFHAMDRTKVPVKHEAKKAFFVALREAFFVWNPQKLKELEDKMRDSGMIDDEIKKQKYFNTQLFKDCVDRKVPESTILYWRVRAVYVAYGDVVDSETKKPLFNKRAWSKAKNVLKEILLGFYSDPPGIELYNKKLRVDGTVMTNKYGLEMLECSRGTNRTEAYHKNITTTFDSWPTGLTMSDCLLRERRHRHNQKVAEKRRFGFHKIGHYDTWLIDLYQSLAQRNHDLLVYPEWTNTSEYKFTNESFDTIPLQTNSLQEAVENRCKELNDKTIKLTKDQQYLAEAMDSKLPFLPITGEEERKTYAKFVTETDASILKDDDAAAVAWCKYVDGVHTFPKLPSHLRTHQEEWKRNQRVKECEDRVASKKAKLEELNKKISPTHRSEINEISTTPPTEAAASQKTTGHDQQQPPRSVQQPMFGVPWCSVIKPAPTFHQPNPQAFIHQPRTMSVGGFTMGHSNSNNLQLPSKKKRQRKRRKQQEPRSCGRCKEWEKDEQYLSLRYQCSGKGGVGRKGCEYYTEDGQPKPCGLCGRDGCKGGTLGKTCTYRET